MLTFSVKRGVNKINNIRRLYYNVLIIYISVVMKIHISVVYLILCGTEINNVYLILCGVEINNVYYISI